MISKKWLAGILAAVIGVTAFGTVAIAKNKGGMHGERLIKVISEKLSLDEGQTVALEALRVEIKETHEAMSTDRETAKAEIAGLLAADSFDQDRALQMINDRVNAVQTNAPDVVSAAAVFFDGLNAEQKSQIQEFIEKKGKRRGRHGNRNNSDQ